MLYKKSRGRWEYLDSPTTVKRLGENFPFGLDEATRYEHFVLRIEPGDRLLLYTDAYTESCDRTEQLLGEQGLLKMIQKIPMSFSVDEFGKELNQRMSLHSEQWLNDDDTTLIALHFTGRRRRSSILEKLIGYWRIVRGFYPYRD